MVNFTKEDEEILEEYEKCFKFYTALPLVLAILVGVLSFILVAMFAANIEGGGFLILLPPVLGFIIFWLEKISLAPMVLLVNYQKKLASDKMSEGENEVEKEEQ